MQGASRVAAAAAGRQLDAVLDREHAAAERSTLSEQLYAVTSLLDREVHLRHALADPSLEPDRKAAMARSLIGDQLGADAVGLVEDVVGQRWSRPRDLVDTFEELAASAAFAAAESAGTLDDVEDELFRFGRVIEREPTLRAALFDHTLPVERKSALVGGLLAERTQPITRNLVQHLVTAPRGRSLEVALETYAALAARRRDRVVADVAAAVPLSPEQEDRLTRSLARIYGRRVALQVSIEPEVVGGISVRVGDELIDGTVANRLEVASRRLAGQ